ncbi:MAG TPA: 3-deoxy-8-phosphooctulonate synthase [Spirochaetota bacterium]|nr:3-deoxy-8-phosphooctulonate synthase [Spirochaetota bacterium]HPN82258.1 3-deoxy-8-phosphooctulonate synthase [Spirochaetota bacterium]
METIETVSIGKFSIGRGRPLALIAGPCVLESEETASRIAHTLVRVSSALGVPFVFKASWDKANRTALSSWRGPGMDEGLEILSRIKQKFGVPVITDVHQPGDCAPVAEVADILQIPAFLCRQTDLLVAAAATGRAVNIKKGQFLSPAEMESAVGKVIAGGNTRVLATERGTSFGYNNLVNDMRSLPVMQGFCPVVFDATHSVQHPGGLGSASGGDRRFVPTLARAAVAAGADAIFLEVHPEPEKSPSDAASIFPLERMDGFLREIKQLADLVRTFPHGVPDV